MSEQAKSGTLSEESKGLRSKLEALVGQTIAAYKVIQRIGSSTVFLAFKDNPDHPVALKVFFPDPYACNREVILERLHQIQDIDHPNVVKVHEVGEERDLIYVIMEYIQGENLYDLMKRNPRLHWAAAAEIAKEITLALVAAHDKETIHRSLHPDRVLLGTGGQIKVNFCNEGEITPSSEIVNYVYPELFLGQDITKSSDIYSLGAIIYTIVKGKPPLAGETPCDIAVKHRKLEAVLPDYGVADVPHSLSTLIFRTMDKEQRYKHCRELRSALNFFLRNDIGNYKIGSYKDLLPKVVTLSESGKAFHKALNAERSLLKQDVPTKEEEDEIKKQTRSRRKEKRASERQFVEDLQKSTRDTGKFPALLQSMPISRLILILFACTASLLGNGLLLCWLMGKSFF